MLKQTAGKKEKACAAILKVIEPGDVVNQVNTARRREIFLKFGTWGIRRYQKHLFGPDSVYHDDHNMLFFDREHTLSVEPPRAVLKPLEKYCLTDLSIYRLTLRRLNGDDIDCLRKAAEGLLDTAYDIGQLVDILINGLLGFEHTLKIRLFDFGKKKSVCSVGVRAVLEHLYQQRIKRSDDQPRTWLFNEINPEKWPPRVVRHYRGTDVEATTPAHFANSGFFAGEFRLVARFKKGKRIYPDTPAGILSRIWDNAKNLITHG